MRRSFQLLSIYLLLLYQSALAQQHIDSIPKLTFGTLNFGFDFKNSNGRYINFNQPPNSSYDTYLYGFSAQLQSSFVAQYLAPRQGRFQVGDLLNGEVGAGFFSTDNRDIAMPLATYYRFDFGLGTIFRVNKNNDLGLNLILLKFARDRVSPNISGSLLQLRYRYKRLVLEAGIEARRDRIFGWLQALQPNIKIPMQYHAHISFLQANSRISGIRLEYLSDKNNEYLQNNMNPMFYFTLKVYHGLYF